MGAGVLVAVRLLAVGQAVGHGEFHATTAVIALLLSVVPMYVWRPVTHSPAASARLALMGSFWMFASTAMLEAVGAIGYDARNDGVRSETLHTVHEVAGGASTLAMVLLFVCLIVAAGSLIRGHSSAYAG